MFGDDFLKKQKNILKIVPKIWLIFLVIFAVACLFLDVCNKIDDKQNILVIFSNNIKTFLFNLGCSLHVDWEYVLNSLDKVLTLLTGVSSLSFTIFNILFSNSFKLDKPLSSTAHDIMKRETPFSYPLIIVPFLAVLLYYLEFKFSLCALTLCTLTAIIHLCLKDSEARNKKKYYKNFDGRYNKHLEKRINKNEKDTRKNIEANVDFAFLEIYHENRISGIYKKDSINSFSNHLYDLLHNNNSCFDDFESSFSHYKAMFSGEELHSKLLTEIYIYFLDETENHLNHYLSEKKVSDPVSDANSGFVSYSALMYLGFNKLLLPETIKKYLEQTNYNYVILFRWLYFCSISLLKKDKTEDENIDYYQKRKEYLDLFSELKGQNNELYKSFVMLSIYIVGKLENYDNEDIYQTINEMLWEIGLND